MSNAPQEPLLSLSQPIIAPPLTIDEEDAIIHTRIINDERPLRRVLKKFYNYTSIAHTPILPPTTDGNTSTAIDDAREAFLLELASFNLTLKKSVLICEAEARQVEEYQRERQRIEDEHGKLKGQIEQLKTALEHAQMERRQKIDYDVTAEKINTLPSRAELEQSINALENDMSAIRAEHDSQNRTIQGQKAALDLIISDLGYLRLMGKDKEAISSNVASPSMTPAPEIVVDGLEEPGVVAPGPLTLITGRERDGKEEGEEDKESLDIPLSASLNSIASPFRPSSQKSLTPQKSISSAVASSKENDDTDDIEMGEVEENPKIFKGKKKAKEDLEEGEASDSSSALSDPPDD